MFEILTVENWKLFNLFHKFLLDVHGVSLFILQILGWNPTRFFCQMFSDIPPNQENILRTFLMIPNDEILRIQVHIRLLIHYLKNKVGVQGAEVISGIQGLSISWKNHCWYWNKPYISRKHCISAFIWHPESGRGIIMRLPPPPAPK